MRRRWLYGDDEVVAFYADGSRPSLKARLTCWGRTKRWVTRWFFRQTSAPVEITRHPSEEG